MSPWRVETSAGCIHAHADPYALRKPEKAPEPVDDRPVEVRMREMKDRGYSWERIADVFRYSTANAAAAFVRQAELRAQREAAR